MSQAALVTTNPNEGALVHKGTETSTAAAMAKARAEVEGMYVMAQQRPRSNDAVRRRVLDECKRSSFAEVALYELPRAGKKITGLSIRFAEAARRIAGNMLVRSSVTYDCDDYQIIQVFVADLETNALEVDEITVTKYQERRSPRGGDEVVGQRTNSSGELVYKIRTTDDDFRTKRRSELQRAKRNAILSLIPGDILDEARQQIEQTRASTVKQDPDAARKKVVDAFAELRVDAVQLEKYLGHDLGSASPDELLELRAVYMAVREGEGSWHQVLAEKTGVAADGDEEASGLRDKIAKTKERLRAKQQQGGAAAPKAAPSSKGAAAAPKAEESKPKAAPKGKGSKKKAEPGPSSKGADDPVADLAKAAGVSREEAEKLHGLGYEVDPQSGDVVPPAGAEG